MSRRRGAADAMEQALRDMLFVKRLDRISVKMICERAGVNRQSFYYHYENIISMVIKVYGREINEAMSGCNTYVTWSTGFTKMLSFCHENKEEFTNAYESVYWDELESCIGRWSMKLIRSGVEQCALDHEIPLDDEDKEFMVTLYMSSLMGMFKWYYRRGLEDDPHQFARKCESMLQGSIEQSCRAFYEAKMQ